MRGLRLGLGLSHSGGAAAATPAYQQLLNRATTDSWAFLYDPTNPDTRTTREDAGTTYISAVSDGLENYPDMVQATESKQPELSVGEFDQLDAVLGDGSSKFMSTASFTAISQPYSFVAIVRFDTTAVNQRPIQMNGSAPSFLLLDTAVPDFRIGSNTDVLTDAPPNTSAHVFSGIFNGASSIFRIDGTQVDSGTLFSATVTSLGWLGRNATTALLNGAASVWTLRADADISAIQSMEDELHSLSGIPKA